MADIQVAIEKEIILLIKGSLACQGLQWPIITLWKCKVPNLYLYYGL